MSHLLCCLSFTLVILAVPQGAAQEPTQRVITVTGVATVHYYPDAARLQFRVRSSEPTLEEVRQANQKALKLVDDKLSALKIKDMKIAFAPINAVAPRTTSRFGEPGGGFAPKGGGERMAEIRNLTSARLATVIVRESDVEKLADSIAKVEKVLFDAGIISGQTTFEESTTGMSVTFFRREEAEFRDEALAKAVQNALQKAKALAKGAGVQIKDTVSIVELGEASPVESSLRSARSISSSSMGELELTVRVTVKCSY